MPRPTPGDRLYRLLLRLLPSEFRGDFGHDMAADFRDERTEARRHGVGAVCGLWARTVGGIVRTAARAWVEDFARDSRYALRIMRRSPGFTAATVVMIGLGTGANAAVFSVVDAVLLHSPFRDPDRLVMVYEVTGRHETAGIPIDHLDRIHSLPLFEAVGDLWGGRAIVTGNGEPYSQSIECVSAGVFEVLGTPARLGRVFGESDDRPGSPPVIVLSDRAWKVRFGADPRIVGRTLRMNGTPATIVGVMPPRFLGPFTRNSTDMWAPLGPARSGSSAIGCARPSIVNMFARVRADLDVRSAVVSGAIADLPDKDGQTGAHLRLIGLDDQTFGDVRSPLLALVGAVLCVLLIACANVANLQLERLLGRRHEIGLRFALGASRSRVVRQILAENVLLGALGTITGLWIAWAALPVIADLVPSYIPHVADIALRRDVLIGSALVTFGAAFAIALVPAAHATGRGAAEAWQAGTRGVTAAGRWSRRVLVMAELALATALLVGAGLAVQTFVMLRPSDPGFDPSNKLVASLRLAEGPFRPSAANRLFVDRLLDRLRTLPDVRAAEATSYVPMSGSVTTGVVAVRDVQRRVWLSRMTEGYLSEVGIPIVEGRGFTAADGAGAPAVAIVNARTARTFWPDGSAVGRTLVTIDGDNPATAVSSTGQPRRVVGIARDTRSLGANLDTQLEVYVPYAQDAIPLAHIVAATAGVPPPTLERTIRQIVNDERPGQVVDRIVPFVEIVDRSVSTWRFGAWLFGAFGALAVVLAGLGLAAVVAWWVSQRTREIGVRMALGASAGAVARLILRQGFTLATAGIVAGVGLAMASTGLLSGWLYGVKPLDVTTFAIGAAAMLGIAGLACYLPARRASRIDPIVTLKAD